MAKEAQKRQRRARKGSDQGSVGMVYMAALPEKKRIKPSVLTAKQIRNLALTDPITWSIMRARRQQVAECQWDVVPDIESYEKDLERWLSVLEVELAGYANLMKFQPEWMPEKWFSKIYPVVNNIMRANDMSPRQKKHELRRVFEMVRKGMKNEGADHAEEVKTKLENPNDEQGLWNTFMNLVIDGILMFDAGIIIKNYDDDNEIGELYTVPPEEIFIYRNEDGTKPVAPEPAFLQERMGQKIAEYISDELLYIMANPQHTGYGFSPIEVSAYTILTSLQIDAFNMDFFKESNIPAALLNLPNVSRGQLQYFRALWEQESMGRLGGAAHKMMMTNLNQDFQYTPLRTMGAREMEMMEYIQWTLSIKCAAFGISPQDLAFTMDLHRTTAEVQYRISRDMGLRTLLKIVCDHINQSIVKKDWKYDDIKYTYLQIDKMDAAEEVNVDNADLQAGIISRNDRRQHIGQPALPGGDIILVPGIDGQMIPIDMLEDQVEDYREQKVVEAEQGVQQPGEEGQEGQPEEEEEKKSQDKEKKEEKPSEEKVSLSVTSKTPPKKEEEKPEKKTKFITAPIDDANDIAKMMVDSGEGDTLIKQYFEPSYRSGSYASPEDVERALGIGLSEDELNKYGSSFASGLLEGTPIPETIDFLNDARAGDRQHLIHAAGIGVAGIGTYSVGRLIMNELRRTVPVGAIKGARQASAIGQETIADAIHVLLQWGLLLEDKQ